MQIVPVKVTHELRVDGNYLGHDLVEEIFDELTIDNNAYLDAKKRKYWGWQKIAPTHDLYKLDGNELVLPRGYALQLKRKLRKNGLKVRWIDRTRWHRGKPIGREEFSFRNHQPAALDAIKHHRQGMYKSPTGGGKSAVGSSVIWDLCPQNTLILVDRVNLVSQWAKDIVKMIDPSFPIGRIAKGKWDEQRITVATVQTLWARRHDLDEEFWEKWDLVILDECHHVTAATFRDLIARLHARYRLGFSATPDKTGEFELAQAVLGPVFHEDSHQELRESGVLIKPKVKVLYSGFDFEYWGDHAANKKGQCLVPDCKNKKPRHRHRNNYGKLLYALLRDDVRNGLIVEILKREADHTVLVCTDQTTHIEILLDAISADDWIPLDDVYVLTGKQSAEERDEIIEKVTKRGHGIILSTIANEAFNLPAIDRVVLGFPTSNAKKTIQQVGRGTRTSYGKSDCLIYDIADDVGPMHSQFRKRMAGCYQPQELDVEIVNPPTRKKGLGMLNAV